MGQTNHFVFMGWWLKVIFKYSDHALQYYSPVTALRDSSPVPLCTRTCVSQITLPDADVVLDHMYK